jgi:TolB protein
VDNPTRIAIVPIQLAVEEDVSEIVVEDLRRSGLFEAMPRSGMLSNPTTAREVYFRDWRIVGMEYVMVGQAVRQSDNRLQITFSLIEIPGERTLFTQVVRGFDNELRDVAHYISDKVFETITGIRGAFSTRLAYVTMTSERGEPVYRLMVSDADGARERLMLKSTQPIMSPGWSPDGSELVYVSFETGRPAIFRQRLSDAHREQVTNFQGLNGAPVWSPDGRNLAMVLSKDGNPEIYLYNLSAKKFTRLTHHFAIDTEPNWAPDGKSMVFTSDRGGTPQIYRLGVPNGEVKRLTFSGTYNARPLLSPDGKTLIMVHRSRGVFHIASLDMARGDLRVLTTTSLDESPTIAPNGAMLLYATKTGDKGVLAAVSLDAGVKYLLPTRSGDVREPAWSPFLR